jgi:hypothetical protein
MAGGMVRTIREAGPDGSRERGCKIVELARTATYPDGKRAGQPIAVRTLRGWVRTYEGHGLLALSRKQRSDYGQKRVIVWRQWDQAMKEAGVPEAKQREISALVDRRVRSLYANGAGSAHNVAFLIQHMCREIIAEAGVVLPEDVLKAICHLPASYTTAKDRRRARCVHLKRSDAAGWRAKVTGGISRDRTGMKPSDGIAGDVYHGNVLCRRPDGTLTTPKIVAFQDMATNRLFLRTFVLAQGEMIRREHVLTALRDLLSDPSWGVYRAFYLDNGSEFKIGEAADDLARIADLVRNVHQIETMVLESDAPEERIGTVTALPYRPKSKFIETLFSALTRSKEPMLPGFMGGNRMAKKTENLGKAPAPIEGDAAEVARHYQILLLPVIDFALDL